MSHPPNIVWDRHSHAALVGPNGRLLPTTLCGRHKLGDHLPGDYLGCPLFLEDTRDRCPDCLRLIKGLGNRHAAAKARAVVIPAD